MQVLHSFDLIPGPVFATEKIENHTRKKQGWDLVVPAWTFANIICFIKSRHCSSYQPTPGGCIAPVSDWTDPPKASPTFDFLLSQIAKVDYLWREILVEKMQKAAGWLQMTGDAELNEAHRKAVEAVGDQYDYAIKWFVQKKDATTTELPSAMQYAALNDGPFICCCLKSIANRQLEALKTLQDFASRLNANFIIADQPHLNKSSLEFFIQNQRYQNQKVSVASRAAQAKIKEQLSKLGYYINKKGEKIKRLGNPEISTTAVIKASQSRQKKSDLAYQIIKPALKLCVDRGLTLREIGYELGFSQTTAAKYKKRLQNGQ